MALRDGEPYLAWGSPGGDQQDQWITQMFLRHVHCGMNLQEAIDAPAWHSEHFPRPSGRGSRAPECCVLESRVPKRQSASSAPRPCRRVGEAWSEGRLTAARQDGPNRRAAANPRGMQGYARRTLSGDGELTNLKIDGARLWDSLIEMAKIRRDAEGGCNRLTLTDLDRQARELFARCVQRHRLQNVGRPNGQYVCAARRRGRVFAAGHDRQPFDTSRPAASSTVVLAFSAVLEVLRTLKDLGVATRHPIEVVNWTNEEGSRFAPAMISSGVFAGIYPRDYAYACHRS
jgi:hypothetical protein